MLQSLSLSNDVKFTQVSNKLAADDKAAVKTLGHNVRTFSRGEDAANVDKDTKADALKLRGVVFEYLINEAAALISDEDVKDVKAVKVAESKVKDATAAVRDAAKAYDDAAKLDANEAAKAKDAAKAVAKAKADAAAKRNGTTAEDVNKALDVHNAANKAATLAHAAAALCGEALTKAKDDEAKALQVYDAAKRAAKADKVTKDAVTDKDVRRKVLQILQHFAPSYKADAEAADVTFVAWKNADKVAAEDVIKADDTAVIRFSNTAAEVAVKDIPSDKATAVKVTDIPSSESGRRTYAIVKDADVIKRYDVIKDKDTAADVIRCQVLAVKRTWQISDIINAVKAWTSATDAAKLTRTYTDKAADIAAEAKAKADAKNAAK